MAGRALIAGCLAICAASPASARADSAVQCQQKLFLTLFDRAPTAAELAAPAPLSRVDAMLKDDAFRDTFARFVNAHMNRGPEDTQERNPVYNMVKEYVLKRERPWRELFTAKIDVVGPNVNPDPRAVGYFENRFWKKRYAGNEEEGLKLRTAYMILNNVIGLQLDALTVTSNGGSARADRADPNNVCVSCHFNLPFALDKVAVILDRVDRKASDDQNTIFAAPLGPAQTIYGTSVGNLEELSLRLTERDEFHTNACHVAFKFVFGRDESANESTLFAACIAAFKKSGLITDAVGQFVRSGSFCPSEGDAL